MKKNNIVFKYKIWFLTDNFDKYEFRYVCAETEEEAEKKLNEYRFVCNLTGFADFIYSVPVVLIEDVII